MAVVQEACVNGVSTRKVDRLVEQMGLRGLSKDQVSRMCRRALDGQVEAFRQGPLEGAYPYLHRRAGERAARAGRGRRVTPSRRTASHTTHRRRATRAMGAEAVSGGWRCLWSTGHA